MNQWEKVPEKEWDKKSKIAGMTGNFLRLPVYRIKEEMQDGKQGANNIVRLRSQIGFANR